MTQVINRHAHSHLQLIFNFCGKIKSALHWSAQIRFVVNVNTQRLIFFSQLEFKAIDPTNLAQEHSITDKLNKLEQLQSSFKEHEILFLQIRRFACVPSCIGVRAGGCGGEGRQPS